MKFPFGRERGSGRETTEQQVERMLEKRRQEAEGELGQPASKNILRNVNNFFKNPIVYGSLLLGLVGAGMFTYLSTIPEKHVGLGDIIGGTVAGLLLGAIIGKFAEFVKKVEDRNPRNGRR